jgi:hypothetical protein
MVLESIPPDPFLSLTMWESELELERRIPI